MTQTLIVLGILVLSFALRTFDWSPFRKLGAFGFLAATFLAGYFLTGQSWWGGTGALLFWFIAPWVELLTRTRRLRLPVKRSLRRTGPPGVQRFPELDSMTEEIEGEGFEYVSDTGWEWDETHQFFRFFYHPETRSQAAICFTEQPTYSWACVTLTSRHEDGRIFRSTNLPFSNPMKSAPNVKVRRNWKAANFADFSSDHHRWIRSLGFAPETLLTQDDPDVIFSQVEHESGRQIRHNVESGIIALCEQADTWRYSWRGLWFVYFQVIKDVVKWC